MIAFQVDDMTCGHCVSTITKAVKTVDKDATVTVDLGRHAVMIEPTDADADELRDAIARAGYTPLPITGVDANPATPTKAGGCCGGCH